MVEHEIRSKYPLRLSSIPAEVILRRGVASNASHEGISEDVPRGLRVDTLRFQFSRSNYPLVIQLPVMQDSVVWNVIQVSPVEEPTRIRNRADHS